MKGEKETVEKIRRKTVRWSRSGGRAGSLRSQWKQKLAMFSARPKTCVLPATGVNNCYRLEDGKRRKRKPGRGGTPNAR